VVQRGVTYEKKCHNCNGHTRRGARHQTGSWHWDRRPSPGAAEPSPSSPHPRTWSDSGAAGCSLLSVKTSFIWVLGRVEMYRYVLNTHGNRTGLRQTSNKKTVTQNATEQS
jgi:hypothetical protein